MQDDINEIADTELRPAPTSEAEPSATPIEETNEDILDDVDDIPDESYQSEPKKSSDDDSDADDDKELSLSVPYRYEENTRSCKGTCAVRGGKLNTYDWLDDLPTPPNPSDLVEVQFKNTRKAYYRNTTGIKLQKGDIVAVESSPGHDIGQVTLLGRLVYLQMHKNHINPATYEYKRVYRIARPTDIEKWEEARSLEQATMLEARRIAQDLRLNMKIGDVEYQGDRTKAIFYYIADERVDFRELIKVLADHFRVRIEMRQIGARQEAGRIGGIGPCGRELCCASWMTSFASVSTHSARIQDLSLNPTKLAGQCGKLKCCLNYELSAYVDAIEAFPPTDKPLETAEGIYYFFKYDIFKKLMWYSPQKDSPSNIVAVTADHVREIQEMNARGERPDDIGSTMQTAATEDDGYSGTVELDEDLTRFDNKKGRDNNRGGRQRGSDNRDSNRRRQGASDERRNKQNTSDSHRQQPNNNDTVQENPNTQQADFRQQNQSRHDGRRHRSGRDNRPRRDNREGRDNRDRNNNTPRNDNEG